MKEHEVDRITLTAYFTGDLPEERSRELREHIQGCLYCRGFLEKLESEKALFLQKHPYESAAPDLSAAESGSSSKGLYAAAALLALFLTAGLYFFTNPREPETRIKGETGIEIHVKEAGQAAVSRTEHVYYPGEYIQVSYSCGKENMFTLMSIDETGKITCYFPAAQESSMVLERGAGIPLPNSSVLDDYLGRELFMAVFSEQKLDLSEVKDGIRRSYDEAGNIQDLVPDLNKKCTVGTILIHKKKKQ
jgi:hypothetical protein